MKKREGQSRYKRWYYSHVGPLNQIKTAKLNVVLCIIYLRLKEEKIRKSKSQPHCALKHQTQRTIFLLAAWGHCWVRCTNRRKHFSSKPKHPTFFPCFIPSNQNKKKERAFQTEEKKKKKKMMGLGWVANQQCRRWTTSRLCGVTLCCICLIFFTPAIPRSPKHHQFVDMRNLLGNHPHCSRDHNFGVNFVSVASSIFSWFWVLQEYPTRWMWWRISRS